MDDLFTYRLLGYNLGVALAAFAIVFWSRRRELVLTLARALTVLLLGWIVGSAIVFIFHVLFVLSGLNIREGSLEVIISLLVLCAVMYPLFTWFCPKANASRNRESNA